jgi:hypothetical protein
LTVGGFKSIRDPTSIELRPLTLLCGANSSGKSAFMQPLLLVKQTLEVGYDPGPLLLDGPNVRFGRVTEMLWKGKAKKDAARQFSVGFTDSDRESTTLVFSTPAKGLQLDHMIYTYPEDSTADRVTLNSSMRHDELVQLVERGPYRQLVERENFALEVQRQRCFYDVSFKLESGQVPFPLPLGFSSLMTQFATRLLHLPGLRDLPERLYPTTQAGDVFPGTFQTYVASVIATWSEANDPRLHALNDDLRSLGLTWKVDAKRVDDTKVALQVGRLPHAQQGGALDLVNIADVGLGVSQTLPILAALRIASRNQIVYLEQPEIHLHPRAQVAIAPILMRAASTGVLVVCETHSHLLLRAIQREVARNAARRELVRLHWFERDDQGVTHVMSTELDELGGYGQLPLDFNEIEAQLETEYLDLVQANW